MSTSVTETKMEPRSTFSPLQLIGKTRDILLPSVLKTTHVVLEDKEALGAVDDHAEIEKQFPKTYGRPRVALKESSSAASPGAMKIGVVLSGGQAPGGHNVIAGIYDYIKKISPDSQMIGFLDGPQGIYNGKYCVVDDAFMDAYRNSGGFDMIGSGRHKIEKKEQFEASMKNCSALGLDGVVVIGGDDSNTNAALLAEYFEANGCKTKVCGAPKTIDGDLKVDPYIPISFGFDTACRTYSELIGNLSQDTLSSQKYYHFVRLMGRAASNIALECALQTRPNICLVSEEVEAKKMTLSEITAQVVAVIQQRAAEGKNYGIVLLPEGLIEFIPEFNHLISEINDVLATGVETTEEAVLKELSFNNRAVFSYLPTNIKQQLLLDRDPHGNVQVAKIETEKLLAQTVMMELEHLAIHGKYDGKFMPQFHSYGYEGRSCLPSTFDATYCYALGQNVAAMLSLGCNGLISSVTNLTAPVSDWHCGGVPITMMCHMERRHGHMKPVIKKALVELDGEPFKCFSSQRDDWAKYDLYRSPGPIQFFTAPNTVELSITLTLELLKSDPRMNPADITAVKSLQDSAPKFGKFIFAPLVGGANAVFSDNQQSRAHYCPPLCTALSDRDRMFNRLVLTSPTQCSNAWDRVALNTNFPCTYGAPLASILPPQDARVGASVNGRKTGSAPVSPMKRPRLSLATRSVDGTTAPLTIGVVFCGRQSPGGHDLIAGVLDALPAGSKLYGFVGGTKGLLNGHAIEITPQVMANYRGQGGYELLGRTMERLEHEVALYDAVAKSCTALGLDGLVMMGGPRSNTDAAYLAEHFKATGVCRTTVVTVPLTMNGGIRNQFVESTVGFDTASKVACQIVGNNSTDGASAKKYYYFQRLMGQEPSHLTLEVALSTKPNFTLLAEEVKSNNTKLADVVNSIADMVEHRANDGKNYGSVIIPEGLIESIPELGMLIAELDAAYVSAKASNPEGTKLKMEDLTADLTLWSKALLDSLPNYIQAQLLLSKTTDNRMLLSQAETERLLAHFVDIELKRRKKKGTYKGSFSVVCSFIGYQARGAAPSNFDVTYAYNLGAVAAALVANELSGYMATINNLKGEVDSWKASGVPITAMMVSDPTNTIEAERALKIPTALLDLGSAAYRTYLELKPKCMHKDLYENPGPTQFAGPTADTKPMSLTLESFDYLREMSALHDAMVRINEACRPGCSSTVLQIATTSLHTLTDTIDQVQHLEAMKK